MWGSREIDKPRVVFDCNVYLQALINPDGPAGRCMTLALARRVQLWASRVAFDELRRVAAYPAIVRAFPHVTTERVEGMIADVEKVATVARVVPTHFTYPRDPDDAHYVDLAYLARAGWLLTRDKDLHDLMTGHAVEAKQFRQLTNNRVRIVTPVVFLSEMPGSPPTSVP